VAAGLHYAISFAANSFAANSFAANSFALSESESSGGVS
jgi:hypothetical protein